MKYCTLPSERQVSLYHEYYRGKWDGETFWKADSLLLDDNVLYLAEGYDLALNIVLHGYDLSGVTEISARDWHKIGEIVRQQGGMSLELYEEIDRWAADVFKSTDCFTIIGI